MGDITVIKTTAHTLVELLQSELGKVSGLPSFTVTADSPSALLGGASTISGNALSMFVYRVEVDTSLRQGVGPSERLRSVPPLLFNLYVLLTPIAEKAEDTHLLLNAAMEVLHSTPVVPTNCSPGTTLTLEISPQPLSPEELTRLWLGLATPYRLSVSYEVRVRFN